MKIDIFTHILPSKYKSILYKYFSEKVLFEKKVHEKRPTLTDHTQRIKILDEYEDMVQVLSVTLPPLEEIVDSERGAELARISNDEMAELVAKYPRKYLNDYQQKVD